MTISSCAWTPSFPFEKNVQLWWVSGILVLCVMSIVLYGTYRCRASEFQDPLTQSLIDRPPWNRFLDGWGVLHFWFFALLTFHFPTCWVQILVAGILWEVIEMMFKERHYYLAKCNSATESKNWWYGRWEDIVMNSLGMLCGLWLAQYRAPGKIIFPGAFVLILIGYYALQQSRKK
jgi:hypothetical protein